MNSKLKGRLWQGKSNKGTIFKLPLVWMKSEACRQSNGYRPWPPTAWLEYLSAGNGFVSCLLLLLIRWHCCCWDILLHYQWHKVIEVEKGKISNTWSWFGHLMVKSNFTTTSVIGCNHKLKLHARALLPAMFWTYPFWPGRKQKILKKFITYLKYF